MKTPSEASRVAQGHGNHHRNKPPPHQSDPCYWALGEDWLWEMRPSSVLECWGAQMEAPGEHRAASLQTDLGHRSSLPQRRQDSSAGMAAQRPLGIDPGIVA